MKKVLIAVFCIFLLALPVQAAQAPATTMHPTWDMNGDGINDCETAGTCDDSVDYTLPRGEDVVSYTENFYKAVNRSWLKKHTIREDQVEVSSINDIIDRINDQLYAIIQKLEKADKLSDDEQKIIGFYRSFIDTEQRNKLGLAPLKDDLQMIANAEDHKDIALLFAKLRKIAVSTPILFVVGVDKKDSNKYLMVATQSGLSLPKAYYLGKDEHAVAERKYYREYLTGLFTLAGFNNVPKRVDKVVQLETELAAIQWSPVENRDSKKTYNKSDFKNLEILLSNFELAEYLTILDIPQDAPFNIMQPSYIAAFNTLFSKTDVETWKDYLSVHFLKMYGEATLTAFDDLSFEYDKKRGLAQKREPMWKRGLEAVNGGLGWLLARPYIEFCFDETSKNKTKQIVENIIKEYEYAITNSTLFSEPTRKKALEKLHKMEFNIGYPDKWRDFSSVTINRNDYFGNLKNIVAYEITKDQAKLAKPVDRSEWGMTPQTLNAFYNPAENKFILLAAILNQPFFDVNGSDAENYGSIGYVIGHEIGHAFDDQGSRYDKDGNMVNWWTKEDRDKYIGQAKRLISQANTYEYLPGKYLQGEREIGEIIGDLNGAQIALRAYMRIIKEQNLDQETELKAFFTQNAKTWRNKMRPSAMEMTVNTDNHPLSEFRVNGILKNLDEFHEVYKTKEGDNMYMAPSERVKLW